VGAMAVSTGGERRNAAAVRRPRVLVVDDADSVRALVATLLGPEYECLEAASGPEALERATSFEPDLIVSDLLMPGMDGYELCRRVRDDPDLASVPFILLTCVTDNDARAHGLEVGADDYLFKPIRRRELVARVGSLLRLHRTLGDLELRTRELEASNRTLAEMQSSLVRVEKLATVGTLVAGVAHEMNNPLSVIKSGAASMGESLGEIDRAVSEALAAAPEERRASLGAACDRALEELRAIAGEMSQGSNRLARIASDLRVFAEGGSAPAEEVDVAAEVQRAWQTARLEPDAAPTLVLEADGVGPIHSVRQLLSQVFVNVLRNAMEAAGPKGRVFVALSGTGSGVSVEVRDTGAGILPEHQPRIFDPFFTTRPGRATGLGLSVAYGIVRSLGGRIDAASVPGQGATFRIFLPRWSPGVDGRELSPARAL
jgi:two-component system, NtrC family, sensor kinase